MKRGIGAIIFGTAAFAGGMIAGLLLTPRTGKENMEWLESQGRKLKADGEKRIDRFSKGIKKTVKDSLPDLYEATEDLGFSEEEEIEEITQNG